MSDPPSDSRKRAWTYKGMTHQQVTDRIALLLEAASEEGKLRKAAIERPLSPAEKAYLDYAAKTWKELNELREAIGCFDAVYVPSHSASYSASNSIAQPAAFTSPASASSRELSALLATAFAAVPFVTPAAKPGRGNKLH